MDNLKSTAAWFVVIIVIGLGGYWAFNTLDTDSAKINSKKEKEVMVAESTLIEEVPVQVPEIVQEKPTEVVDKPLPTATQKYQSLIDELKTLMDKKIEMRLKSQGLSVGTIQKVLNLYNNTTKRIDNDYGPSVKERILAFQKAEGVTQTGETGNLTYQAMIDWLKKQ